MRRIQLIVNPISGKGLGGEAVAQLEQRLQAAWPQVEVATFVTQRRADAQTFAASLDGRTSLVVVVGGDGTLHEVINGQIEIPLTVFPTGTGNAFATDRGLQGDFEAFDQLLRTGVVERFDLGVANEQKFINMAAAGILGQIHRAFWQHRHERERMGRLVREVLRVLGRHEFPPVSVRCDGAEATQSLSIVVVGNTALYAPGVRFTPDASPSDGLLDVCTFPVPSPLDLPRWLVALLRGRHLDLPEIRYQRARNVRLEGPAVPCHLDGEYMGTTPLTISIRPRSVAVLVPASDGQTPSSEGPRTPTP